MMLSAEFNKIPAAGDESTLGLPLLYGTYQAYLQRSVFTPFLCIPYMFSNLSHIESSLQHAKANSYCLGVKIVRGAYHGQELDHWRETNPKAPPPVWPTKAETDACYNTSKSLVMKQMADDARYHALLLAVVFCLQHTTSRALKCCLMS
jgi:proline dehydrogenase